MIHLEIADDDDDDDDADDTDDADDEDDDDDRFTLDDLNWHISFVLASGRRPTDGQTQRVIEMLRRI